MHLHATDTGRRLSIWPSVRSASGALLVASPLLFGVPVVLGIAITVANLLGTPHPELGWATTVSIDAKELFLGHTLYQDPAHGYTGMLYTPLFPAVTSLLYHVSLWDGWPLLVVIGATVSLLGLAARIAYAPAGPGPRVVRLLTAVGVGGIAYWCVSSVPVAALDEARADQLAWALALFGLVAVADFGPAPSRRRVVLAALLLSAGFWTKQPTIGVAVLAAVWVLGLAAGSAISRQAARLFVALLVVVNLAVLLVLNLLTDGWEFYFNFEMPTAHWTTSHYGPLIEEGLRAGLLAAAFIGVTWLAGVVMVARDRRRGATSVSLRELLSSRLRSLLAEDDPTGRRALLLGLYSVLGFALAVYFRRKQGSSGNQFVGLAWTLGLFAAAGWRLAQRNTGTAVAAGGCVALLFVVAHLGPVRAAATSAEIEDPDVEAVVHWGEVPGALLAWATDHTIYTPLHSDLNVPEGGPLYPNFYNIADLLAAGRQPMYLVRALLNRRFDDVQPFELSEDPYTSAFGKWEENYLWKLNEVIAARYVEAPGLPGLLERRPGPEQAPWMRSCFGPFAAGGASFRIGHGGGFWCSFSPNHLNLVHAPVPLSEVLTTQPVRASGTVTVGLEGGAPGHINLVLEHERTPIWTTQVATSPTNTRELVVSSYLGGTPLGSTAVTATNLPGGVRGVRLELTATHGRPGVPQPTGPGEATLTTPATDATFALVATNGAYADLSAAHLGS